MFKRKAKQASFNPGLFYKFLEVLHENLGIWVYWFIVIAIAFEGAPPWLLLGLGVGGVILGSLHSHEKAQRKRNPEYY
jgi:hypothetical protein